MLLLSAASQPESAQLHHCWFTELGACSGVWSPAPGAPTFGPRAAEGDGRGRGGACQEMAAVTVNSAKRGLRAELKQRLRALDAEERLRQSRLLTQKVREDCRELNARKVELARVRRRTSPGRVRVLLGARSAGRGGLCG